jgi:Domain of unknown function (DUF4178)
MHRATAPNPDGHDLSSLRPGALLRMRGTDYLIERSLRLEQGDYHWTEHRLSSDASGRTLWLEVPDDDAAPVVVFARGSQQPPLPRPDLPDTHAEFVLRRAGTPRYRTVERAGIAKIGTLMYVEYASGARRLAFERHGRDDPWQVWHGHELDRSEIEPVRR